METNVNTPNDQNLITYDDFVKLEIRAGFVESCEKIETSTKMLKLQVDFGSLGKKQILTGVGDKVSVEEINQKSILFVFNLKPRKIMGFESQGMIMGSDEDTPKIVYAPNGVLPGTRII